MNTYDPADYIVYVHIDQKLQSALSHLPSVPAESPLPSGYANASPRTRLRNGTAVRPSRSSRQRPADAVTPRHGRRDAAGIRRANEMA